MDATKTALLGKTQEPSAFLLDFAKQDLQYRAGYMPQIYVDHVDTPARADGKPLCSAQAADTLGDIISRRAEPLLIEWLQLMGDAGVAAPPEYLPILLDWFAAEPHLQVHFDVIAQNRGYWLIQQHDLWRTAFQQTMLYETDIYSDWWAANQDSLLTIGVFERMRQINPDRARHLLQRQWSRLKTTQRVNFIWEMMTGLSEADEPFLESLINDVDIQVRFTAQIQLTRIPKSRYLNRMIGYAVERFLMLVGEDNLYVVRIDLSFEPTQQMVNDGIIDIRAEEGAFSNQLRRREAVRHMLDTIPPSFWCEHFNMTAKSLYDICLRSGWSDLLTRSFAKAAVVHQDKEWARVLVNANIGENRSKIGERSLDLIEFLPDEERNAYYLQFWKSSSITRRQHLVYHLTKNTWSRNFSRQILNHLYEERSHYKPNWMGKRHLEELTDVIKMIAYYIHPAEIDHARRMFKAQHVSPFFAELPLLELRAKMHEAFQTQ